MSDEHMQNAWKARRDRSVSLVGKAIKNLQDRREVVTVQAIHAETKRIDPDRLGVHPTTYRRNPDVDALVSAAAKRPSAVEWKLDLSSVNTANLRPERDIRLAFHRLKSKTKRELVIYATVLEEELLAAREMLKERDTQNLQRRQRELGLL